MDYTTTIFSNRLYELNPVVEKEINDTIYKFSSAVYSSYERHFLKEYNEEEFNKKYGTKDSFHMLTKNSTGFDTYYSNSVESKAKGYISSQKELNRMYQKDKNEQLKQVEKNFVKKKINLLNMKNY